MENTTPAANAAKTTSAGKGRESKVLATYKFLNGWEMTVSKVVFLNHKSNSRLNTEYRVNDGSWFKTAKAAIAYAERAVANDIEQQKISNFHSGKGYTL